jgi:cytochrome c peroxidase
MDVAMENRAVFGGTWEHGAQALEHDQEMVAAFREIYPEGLTPQSLREAIAMYCLSLVTPDSKFDRYLREELALDAEEQAGYELFREYGCVSCHQGINIGGNMLQRFGVMRDYFADRGHVAPADYGLYTATSREEDRFVFRVPSLRNVALTAPYFHDGSATTLEQAVDVMALYQLGRSLSPEDVARIVAFLRTLTGELSGQAS